MQEDNKNLEKSDLKQRTKKSFSIGNVIRGIGIGIVIIGASLFFIFLSGEGGQAMWGVLIFGGITAFVAILTLISFLLRINRDTELVGESKIRKIIKWVIITLIVIISIPVLYFILCLIIPILS